MAIDQLGGQQTLGDQLLRPVDIREYAIEHLRTLGDAPSQFVPFGGGDDLGQQVQFPRAVGAVRVGVDVVGDAVFPQLPVEQGLALGQLLRAAALQVGEQLLPVRTHAAVDGQHFMPGRGAWGQGIQQVGHRGAHRGVVGGMRQELCQWLFRCLVWPHRWQASSHRVPCQPQNAGPARSLWELACQR